ncbi:hypothetical protein GRI58_08045 [Porphyrobacter algicida]|uniref:Uncharacterized protein n=1 Tax=Qipengyuania algicida TaxID=1836209 RepID=A0A845AIN2_9SPHN|nr:hypothetical protein [Qipengyuania algicida]
MVPSGFVVAQKQPPNSGGWAGLYEITSVSWSSERRELEITIHDHVRSFVICFLRPVSFCSQDEADMLDYWSARHTENVGVATIYTLAKSDYLARIRGESTSALVSDLTHWLVVGVDQCVEIICREDSLPSVRETNKRPEN